MANTGAGCAAGNIRLPPVVCRGLGLAASNFIWQVPAGADQEQQQPWVLAGRAAGSRPRLHLERREQSGRMLLESAQVRGGGLLLRSQRRLAGLQRRQRPPLLVCQFRLRKCLCRRLVKQLVQTWSATNILLVL